MALIISLRQKKQYLTNEILHCRKLWLTCDFSLYYPYIIQQTRNENTQTYQVEVVILIEHQILVTYLQGNV